MSTETQNNSVFKELEFFSSHIKETLKPPGSGTVVRLCRGCSGCCTTSHGLHISWEGDTGQGETNVQAWGKLLGRLALRCQWRARVTQAHRLKGGREHCPGPECLWPGWQLGGWLLWTQTKNSYQETSSSSCHRGYISYRNKEQGTYINWNGDLFFFLAAIVRSLHLILKASYFASVLYFKSFLTTGSSPVGHYRPEPHVTVETAGAGQLFRELLTTELPGFSHMTLSSWTEACCVLNLQNQKLVSVKFKAFLS